MADPHDDPPPEEAIVSPTAGRQEPDPPDTGGDMIKEEENESSHRGGSAGHGGDGEGGMEVAPPSSGCIMRAADSQDCAPSSLVATKGEGNDDDGGVRCGGDFDGGGPSSDASGAKSGGITGEICEEVAVPPASQTCPTAPDEGAATDATPVFVEAERDGDWFKAIEARDCLSLMSILNAQVDDASRVPLCFRTGEQSRTALHVAAMQGCFRLAKQLIDLIRVRYSSWQVREHGVLTKEGLVYSVHNLSSVAVTFIYVKDGRSELSAYEMANDIIGNTSISQYILYVGPKQEDMEYSGMYEAYGGTPWHTALAQGDCKSLKRLLKWNSRCVLETCGGLSVLDVAVLKGDKELVEQVMRLFWATSDGPKISWHEESYFPSELKWEQIAKRSLSVEFASMDCFSVVKSRKNLQLVGSALELAEKCGISEEIKGLLQNVGEHIRRSKGDDVNQEGVQHLLTSLSSAGFLDNGVGSWSSIKRESIALEALEYELECRKLMRLVEVIQENWKPEWTAGFMADVDYNFEDKRSLRFSMLRLHYAFKHPRECSSLIDSIPGMYVYAKFKPFVSDGQGRLPIHVLVDHYNPKDFSFDELSKILSIEMIYECDSRGRPPMIRAITKQFLEQDTMASSHLIDHCIMYLSELNSRGFGVIPYEYDLPNKIILKSIAYEKLRDHSQKSGISMFHWLFIASFLFESVHVLNSFEYEQQCENKIKDFLKKLSPYSHYSNCWYGVSQSTFLFIASALGNQEFLRECFKYKIDCMVEDTEGRTALHYAADPNVLNYFPLPTSFFCSIDYSMKAEEKWMNWQNVGQGNLTVGQDTSGRPQSNASVGRKACILMLLQAGVDLSQADKRGNIPDPDSSSDAEFQSWWYNILVKDSEDKKNSFNQAGNALSVVGALVAATSYIGPLQPPLNYTHTEHNGYVDTSRALVKVFMWTNTLAFYLAVASVMFAVVPSLPMPQEGVIDELRRARHTVSSSLFLLLASIGCILASFAVATAVVIDNGEYYGSNDFLLSPSVVGWFFCAIAMVSFFIRVMRLVFYRNATIRRIYKFSFSTFLKSRGKPVHSAIARHYREIIGKPVLLLLVVPAYLERGLIWMIFLMGRALRRVRKERIRHQELGNPFAQEEESPELPEGSIWKFRMWLENWVLG